MSTLQCPATLLLAAPGFDPPAGQRVAHVWSQDELPDLSSDDVSSVRQALGGMADQTPGETTLLPILDDRLRATLPQLARIDLDPDALRDAPVLALVIDADDWLVRIPD